MLSTRTSLLAWSAAAAIVVAGSTAAQAGGKCFGRSFGHNFGHRAVLAPVSSYTAIAQPTAVGNTAVARSKGAQTASKQASRTRPAAKPAKPADDAQVTTTAETSTCLTKEYLDTGAVMFRDTCTNEWAINSTNSDKNAAAAERSCLTKDSSTNGVVMFKDLCTSEWAMNTADQQAQSPLVR